MSINFTQIIKDSFHFIQNEKQNVIILSTLYFFAIITIALLQSSMLPNEIIISLTEKQISPAMSEGQAIDLVIFFFLKQIIYIFISAWCLVSIHQISLRHFNTLQHSFSITLKRIWGVILISFVIFIPIFIGLTEAIIAIQQKIQPSIISLLAIIIGIGLYIRLCLAPVHYLLTDDTMSTAGKTIWRAAIGRVSMLVIFCLLIYVLIPMAENFLVSFSTNSIMALITGIMVAFLNIFALIVTYRFYTRFIQKV
ncbi:beta-methylgalactoside transporter [Aggregatibacter actinomycetemcomitans]|uniref:beta-methylgalactoside transporter n=1 Tax=Aggregatibacter actinomycetemcomitans TaxID=714 RepID=UPI00197C13EE|nr:beta-methylgalactoside transporter [Aggregatibacter actinomycetemcomitans]MBN6064062.1 beta-methylgalactoside transporter [Aggregatibacter actinomycetemcomitans]MBN6081642.1 beta-methylgalactoside transporter [Aggregatibacter actinomycetemcomitans]MBN6083963.1 beta-methylgalactoside transporter [Aggregatibacter actinomycetemcomitans]